MATNRLLDYESDAESQISALIQQISECPIDLKKFVELRAVAMIRKSKGGKPMGIVERLRSIPPKPLDRMIHLLRFWAFDPGNLDWLMEVSDAVDGCVIDRPDLNLDAVRRWLRQIAIAAS